ANSEAPAADAAGLHPKMQLGFLRRKVARATRTPRAGQPRAVREALKLTKEDLVMNSLRHTILIRVGKAGADAFKIMRTAGHGAFLQKPRKLLILESSGP